MAGHCSGTHGFPSNVKSLQACHSSGNEIQIQIQILQGHGSVRELFEWENLSYNTTDLKPMMFFSNEEGKFVENLSVLNRWVERTVVRGGRRPLL